MENGTLEAKFYLYISSLLKMIIIQLKQVKLIPYNDTKIDTISALIAYVSLDQSNIFAHNKCLHKSFQHIVYQIFIVYCLQTINGRIKSDALPKI